ncbi:MAG: hypothetical protein ABSC91_07405 [Candidatus Bathyarchaeia archaeon]
MRVDDYRYYGQICLGFGIILLVVGVVLPIFIISWFTDYGIAMAVVGAILIIVSQILYREYRLRSTQQQKTN